MGNDHGKPQKHAQVEHATAPRFDHRVSTAYESMKSNGELNYSNFLDMFGEDLAESLWAYFTEQRDSTRLEKNNILDKEQFNKHVVRLMGSSHDIYISICQPVHHLIKVCSESAGAIAVEGDQHFIKLLAEQATKNGKTEKEILMWVKHEIPKLAEYVQGKVLHKLLKYELDLPDLSSDLLTPLQMWYVQAILPPVYFPDTDKPGQKLKQWTPLYNSATQGVSVNRFEANVFDYRGPTVSFFQLVTGEVVVIATDQEWRNSGSRFGGPSTTYLQIYPSLMKIEESSSIYCNFKIRAAAFGLSFKSVFTLDKDMSQLRAVEVWGCAAASTKLEQQKLKEWQGNQAEKHKKVPLPGNWDDNPDKTLLEMAGFQFSNERKLMEEAERKMER